MSQNVASASFIASSSQYAKSGQNPTNLNVRSAITVEAWVKPTTIAHGDMTVAARWSDTVGGCQFTFQINRNTGGKVTFLYSVDGTNALSPADSTDSIVANEWHHIAFTWDGSNYAYYIDGVASGTGTFSATFFDLAAQFLSIGAQGLPDSFFDGLVDEVRVWNVARTQAQILETWKSNLVGNETGLVGNWSLDNNWYDRTSNANHLTAQNSATFSNDKPYGNYGGAAVLAALL